MSLAVLMADSLIQARTENKVSINSLAKKLHTDTKQLWRLEKKKVNCHINTYEKYANALGYTVKVVLEKL